MSDSDVSASDDQVDDGLPPISPDFIERDLADELDNVIPTRGYQMLPMVGLGGSAGSIQALVEFFKAMPAESGMVFVVILHLSPTHESTLAALLANSTSMPVVQATDSQKVEANHVYVIPPGKYLATANGHLRLTDLEHERGKRVAVDFFFRTLADTHGPHSAAIVLSGADGDGAVGIKRIKERGGLTIAQDPSQAEHPGMPRSAIETGMVDWVLEVEKIPNRLIEYYDTASRLKLPPEEGPQPSPQTEPTTEQGEAALRDLMVFMRMRTGRDFSCYKRATILRRIARRMQVNGVEDLPGYVAFLRTHPGEAGALVKDLLISVTNFFRDREVFAALQQRVPELFEGKNQDDTVRIWSPACATGEEAYSLAMIFLEYARTLANPPALQVFACDLDDEAVQIARVGHYGDSITADVSEDRLRQFFVKGVKGYQVRRELRETILFASHDLLKDAPFSRMDLISCRNLLIYLNRDAQQRVFETFHFALKPGGLLLLGSSEAIEDGSPLFRIVDKKNRIYAHQSAMRVGLPLPSGPSSLLRKIEAQDKEKSATVVHGKQFQPEPASSFQGRLGPFFDRATIAELHFKLIERYSPPSVVVNAEHEVMHFSQRAKDFLHFAAGEPTMNLLRIVEQDLRIDLRTALFRAAETGAQVESSEIPAQINGESCLVQITVSPSADIAPDFMLVTFHKSTVGQPPSASNDQTPSSEPAVLHLERELVQLKHNLRTTVEQYEASTEELKASNEELQAMNEELRSATEELETSREELQSINEELTTVNQEMKVKMEEVAHANSDLQNLMASTSIATVFLDRDLAIGRFTPAAAAIFNMIPGDVGRPLAHLKYTLEYPNLIADAQEVVRTLIPTNREVSDGTNWYLARIQPYRTIEDHIAGAVLTLVDVTERNTAMQALRASEERMRLLIESAKDFAIVTIDLNNRIESWNKGAEALFGYAENEIIGETVDRLFTPEDCQSDDPKRELQTSRRDGRALSERWHMRKDGSMFFGSGSVTPLYAAAGILTGYVKIMRDLTEHQRTQEMLRKQVDELLRFNNAAVGRETRMIELKKEINDLCRRSNLPSRYSLDWDREQGAQES